MRRRRADCGRVGVSKAVDDERRGVDLPGEADEGAVEAVRSEWSAEWVGEYQRTMWIVDPGRTGELLLVVLLPTMVGKHGDGLGVERDRAGGGPGVEVDVVPPQSEDLASACSGGAGEAPRCMERVVAYMGEEAREGRGVPRLVAGVVRAGPLRRWRVGERGDVAWDVATFGGLLQRSVEHAVDVADGLGRQAAVSVW